MTTQPVPPHPPLERYYASETERQRYLSSSFDSTAGLYDSINSWMSFGTDRWYRRQALLRGGLGDGMRVVDVGCGTGLASQIARQIVGPRGAVLSVDPSEGMLAEAVSRGRVTSPLRGTAEDLPLADGAADFLCMSFALRHVADLAATFAEFRRVLKPGGRVLLLEMTPPREGVVRALLKVHMRYLTPFVTRLATGSGTATLLYEYCWDTFDHCVPPASILDSLATAGFAAPSRHISARIFSEYGARAPG